MQVIDLNYLLVVIPPFLAMFTALVTDRLASSRVKSLTLATLSGLSGVVVQLQNAHGVLGALDWNHVVADAVVAFQLAGGWHHYLLKPTGVTGADGVLQRAVPDGIGGPKGTHMRVPRDPNGPPPVPASVDAV